MPQRQPGDGLALGGSLRARIEWPDRKLVDSDRGTDRAISFWRALGSVDATTGPVSGHLELATHVSLDDRRIAIETDPLDVQQAFLDFTAPASQPRDLTRLRLGRAEMVFEFLALRNAPNVRRSWDGARFTVARTGWTLNAFRVRQVRPRTGVFDDSSARTDRLAGAHVRLEPGTISPFGVTAWFYDTRQPLVRLSDLAGPARTQTLGLIIDASGNGFGGSAGGGLQRGRLAVSPVRAYYLEAELNYRWANRRWPTFAALRASAFSGGAAARAVRTFNPLFPNYAYSTEAALQSPSNLVKAGPILEARPTARVKLEYRGEGLWRYSARDAFYGPQGGPLVPPAARRWGWLGVQQQVRATWTLSPGTEVTAAMVHFLPGRFLRDADRRSGLFAMLQMERRF